MTTGVTEAFDARYQAHLEPGNKDLVAYPGATDWHQDRIEVAIADL